jgi:putative copper export protein
VLSPSIDTFRLVLHIIGAAVWVGGQLVLAGLVPTVRRTAPDALKPVANAFSRIAWPAYGLVFFTGLWSLVDIDVTATSSEYQVTLGIKILLVVLAGASAAAHAAARSKVVIALGGALGAFASVAALFLGVLLRTGS